MTHWRLDNKFFTVLTYSQFKYDNIKKRFILTKRVSLFIKLQNPTVLSPQKDPV